MIRKILACILFFNVTATAVYADWSITTPAQISAIDEVAHNVSCSFDPTTGKFLAVWKDYNTNQAPYYSFYIPDTGWTAVAIIAGSTIPQHDVYSACNSSTGVSIAAWGDASNNNYPTYSIYTPGLGWSTIDTITTSFSVASGQYNVFLSFDSVTGNFIATWTNSSGYPTYAFYTPGTGWGTPNTISGTSQAEGSIFSVADSINGTIMAAWSDLTTNYPTYSIYTPGSGWSPSTTITTASFLYEDVYLSFDSTTGQTLATWGNSEANSVPVYSFFTPGMGWSTMGTLPGTTKVDFDITTSFDPVTGQFLAAWSDHNHLNRVTYSFYTAGSGWSSPAFLSVAAARDNVFLVYGSLTGQILSTWTGGGNGEEEGTQVPYYAFFDGPAPQFAPIAPASFSGKVTNNRFLTQTDIINKLNWTPANDSTIVSYVLRRNGVLIYTAPSTGPYTYEDHNRLKNVTYVYTLTSQNQKGVESSVLTVTIN
ncbi:MAG: hypothetical protein WCF65_05625 [Parachlamydiaceae bacterium]